jgi:addiction module HigA family antidote
MIKSFEHKGLEKYFYKGKWIIKIIFRRIIMPIRKRQPTHPGGILKRQYIEPLSLKISAVTDDLRVSRKTISKIVNEKGSITPDIALRLSKAFNTSPELWLNLQTNYDLWVAAHKSNDWENIKTLVPA